MSIITKRTCFCFLCHIEVCKTLGRAGAVFTRGQLKTPGLDANRQIVHDGNDYNNNKDNDTSNKLVKASQAISPAPVARQVNVCPI